VGSITPGRHDFVTFFAGARRFLDNAPEAPLVIRFVGEDSPLVREQAAKFGLADRVSASSRVSHADAVGAMRTHAINLFLPWQDPEHPGVYSGKLFEYLGARRPILAVGADPGVAGALVEESRLGKCARNAEQAAALLLESWAAHRAGRDAWTGDEAVIARHSHREMAKQFAEELARCAASRAR
jgi:hypothetical protein